MIFHASPLRVWVCLSPAWGKLSFHLCQTIHFHALRLRDLDSSARKSELLVGGLGVSQAGVCLRGIEAYACHVRLGILSQRHQREVPDGAGEGRSKAITSRQACTPTDVSVVVGSVAMQYHEIVGLTTTFRKSETHEETIKLPCVALPGMGTELIIGCPTLGTLGYVWLNTKSCPTGEAKRIQKPESETDRSR